MHTANSLSRPLPPPLPIHARHPLDLDPLDFRRPRPSADRVVSKVGDPPSRLKHLHRPAVLNEVLEAVREHLRDPVRVVAGTAASARELHGLLSFHQQADGSMVVLSHERRTWTATKRTEVDAYRFDVERMLPLEVIEDAVRRELFDAVFRADVAHPSTIKDYVEWAHGALCGELAHDDRWKGVADDWLPELGFEPYYAAIARNLPHPPGMPAASLAAYNHVLRHAAEFEQVLEDDDALLALYSVLCEFGGFPAAGEPLARLRTFLKARGLSAALWRGLAGGRCDPLAAFDPTTSRTHDAAACMRALKLLDRIGPEHAPPAWLVRSLFDYGYPFHDANVDSRLWRHLALARRIAVLHARADDDTRLAMREVLPLALDWMDVAEDLVKPSLRRMSWHSIARYARRLRGDRAAMEARLPVPFDRLEFDGWEFRTLSSGAALREEGIAMRHCLGNVVEPYARGDRFACSMRRLGAPDDRWTVSFVRHVGRWHVGEFAGRANARAPDDTRLALAPLVIWLDDRDRAAREPVRPDR